MSDPVRAGDDTPDAPDGPASVIDAQYDETGRPRTPGEAWQALADGNARFVAGRASHPNQDVERRNRIAVKQKPFALFFGCADSRLAAEIIFDQGLGDLFVVRTAGHVVDSGVLGSLEFGVGLLGIPLVVVLGHDSCGAVSAAIESFRSGAMPRGYIRDVVERVTPSVLSSHRDGSTSTDDVEAEHVRHTIHLIVERSTLLAERVADGRLAILGATYRLVLGKAVVIETIGQV